MHESEGDHVRTCHGRHAARMCSLLSRAAWASLCTQIVPLAGQGAEFAAPAAAEHVLLLQKEQAAWDGASCKHHSHQSWGCRARVASADATSKHQYQYLYAGKSIVRHVHAGSGVPTSKHAVPPNPELNLVLGIRIVVREGHSAGVVRWRVRFAKRTQPWMRPPLQTVVRGGCSAFVTSAGALMRPLRIVTFIRGGLSACAVRHGTAAGPGSCGGRSESLLLLAGGGGAAAVGGDGGVGLQLGGHVHEAHRRAPHVRQRQMLLPPLQPPSCDDEGRIQKRNASRFQFQPGWITLVQFTITAFTQIQIRVT